PRNGRGRTRLCLAATTPDCQAGRGWRVVAAAPGAGPCAPGTALPDVWPPGPHRPCHPRACRHAAGTDRRRAPSSSISCVMTLESSSAAAGTSVRTDSIHTVFLIFLRLGLTSFGGPVAHLAYFRQEFVVRRQWLSDASYADLMALCQFLPGPSSSQVGMALGLQRAGYGGALAAWAGFTLPSAVLLIG